MSPPKEITLELKVKVCTIKSDHPSPVVHNCPDLEQYVQFLELVEEAYEDGLFAGLERGAYQNKLETARSLLSEGLAPQMVARCTSLPLETVQQLVTETTR